MKNKTIDFSKVSFEFRIGEPETADMRKIIGNAVNQNTSDIGLADFARKIYYTEGPIELPAEYASKIVEIVEASPNIIAAAKIAVVKEIREALPE